jgi:hypothetical protein
MPEYWMSGTRIRVPQSGTAMLGYRTEMLVAGIPMPAATASMPSATASLPMPSYGYNQLRHRVLYTMCKAGLVRDHRYQTDTDAGMPMPD